MPAIPYYSLFNPFALLIGVYLLLLFATSFSAQSGQKSCKSDYDCPPGLKCFAPLHGKIGHCLRMSAMGKGRKGGHGWHWGFGRR